MAVGIPDITAISISIYDTTLPEVVDPSIIDFAEKGSIHWIYDGGDSKLITMMASRLEFDMEVSIEESLNVLVYDYLFTGNETRYSCVMCDQDDNVIWRGFLLPEEYQEPYDKGTFFIHFTATDGLGRLKGKTLPNSFYRAKQSVTKAIANCLEQTGLQLEIWMDHAIHNRLAGPLWQFMYFDAAQYKNDNDVKDCYTILENLLLEMGATIFQQNERWYILGVNKRGLAANDFRKYDYLGNQIGIFTLANSVKYAAWYATPSIFIKPPFKEVAVKENLSETITLFPKKLINQPFTVDSLITPVPTIDYWKIEGAGSLELVETSELDFKEYDGESFEQDASVAYRAFQPDIDPVPLYPSAAVNYIDFYKPIFIKGGQYIDFDFVWDMRIFNPGNDDILEYVNNANYYEITLNGTVIISNRLGFPSRKNYLWTGDIIWVDDYTTLTATVKVRRFLLPETGFLNLKFLHPATSVAPAPVYKRIKTLSFDHRKNIDSTFKKRRIIDYTNKNEITLANGGSVYNAMQNSFIYQPEIPESEMVFIPFATFNAEEAIVSLGLPYYLAVEAGRNKIYVRRQNSDFFEYINQIEIVDAGSRKVKIVFEDGHRLMPQDEIYIRPATAGSPQVLNVIKAREEWQKTTNSNGVDRLGNVLAEMYHDVYPDAILTMEGTLKGLTQPKDVMQFEIKNKLYNFIPVRIDITPNENQTSVSLIAYQNEKVTDYGG